MVNQILQNEMSNSVHALSIQVCVMEIIRMMRVYYFSDSL